MMAGEGRGLLGREELGREVPLWLPSTDVPTMHATGREEERSPTAWALTIFMAKVVLAALVLLVVLVLPLAPANFTSQ
jgi:hypothetical protein